MKNKIFSLILIASALFALSACGKGKGAASGPKNEAAPKTPSRKGRPLVTEKKFILRDLFLMPPSGNSI